MKNIFRAIIVDDTQRLVSGNSKEFFFIIVGADNVKLNQARLDDTSEIRFVFKNEKADLDVNAVLNVTKTGASIVTLTDATEPDPDNPIFPNLKVTLTRAETLVPERRYFLGLEIIFNDNTGGEPVFVNTDGFEFDVIEVLADIIRGV